MPDVTTEVTFDDLRDTATALLDSRPSTSGWPTTAEFYAHQNMLLAGVYARMNEVGRG